MLTPQIAYLVKTNTLAPKPLNYKVEKFLPPQGCLKCYWD